MTEKTLYSTWCKVPHLSTALSLARAAGIEFVVYADTDVGPQPSSAISLERIVSCLHSSVHVALMAAEWQPWDCEAGRFYPHGTVNSGVMLFRASPESESFVRSWWIDSVRERTPFERSRDAVEIDVGVDVVDALPSEKLQEVASKLASRLRAQANVTEFYFVNPYLLRFVLPPSPSNGKADGKRLAEKHPAYKLCCSDDNGGICRTAYDDALRTLSSSSPGIRNGGNPPAQCRVELGDTLSKWPGDQDRLNHLFTRTARSHSVLLATGRCDPNTASFVYLDPDAATTSAKLADMRARLERVQSLQAARVTKTLTESYDWAMQLQRLKWRMAPVHFPCDADRIGCAGDGSTIGSITRRPKSVFHHWLGQAEDSKRSASVDETVRLAAGFGMSFDAFVDDAWERLQSTVSVIRLPKEARKMMPEDVAKNVIHAGEFIVVGSKGTHQTFQD